VDVVAPGGGVLAPTRAGGHQYWEGTSFAAGFVSATAALVRQAWPRLTAAQVAARIVATATPAPGGVGLVNPYRAVTDGLVAGSPAVAPPVRVARPAPADDAPSRAVWLVVGAAATAVLVLMTGAAVLGRGRRQRWRARPAAPLPEPEPPGAADPPQLFTTT
jgi:subtilisin family serine protease